MATIEGREKLRRKFAAMPQAVREEVGAAVKQGAEELVSLQKRLVPVDKGTLRDSIRYEINEGENFRATIIAGGTQATKREVRKGSGVYTDEAILNEFGTKSHIAGGEFQGATIPAEPASPFFLPAWRALKGRIRGRVSRSFLKGIKKIADQ